MGTKYKGGGLMLLCIGQENPIRYREKEIRISEELLNLYYMIYGCPVGEADINMWLAFETNFRNDRYEIVDYMSAENLSKVVCDAMAGEMNKVIAWAVTAAVGTN